MKGAGQRVRAVLDPMNANLVVGVRASHSTRVKLRHVHNLELAARADSVGGVILLGLKELLIEHRHGELHLMHRTLDGHHPARALLVIVDRAHGAGRPAHEDAVEVLVAEDQVARVLGRVVGAQRDVLFVFRLAREPLLHLLRHATNVVFSVVGTMHVQLEVLHKRVEGVARRHERTTFRERRRPVTVWIESEQPRQLGLEAALGTGLEFFEAFQRDEGDDEHDFTAARVAYAHVCNRGLHFIKAPRGALHTRLELVNVVWFGLVEHHMNLFTRAERAEVAGTLLRAVLYRELIFRGRVRDRRIR
mmetsp:Transcript_75327/g.214245  ORF Transcript_75327/g.214245 Transcript_75327/m.214245 type:complete len:305 (-) Transcript_75327:151-1065(-)